MHTLSLRHRDPAAKPRSRGRNQFRAWLILQLNLRGARLPADPPYKQLREATRRYLVPRA